MLKIEFIEKITLLCKEFDESSAIGRGINVDFTFVDERPFRYYTLTPDGFVKYPLEDA